MFFYADLPAVPSGARLEGRSIYRGDAMIEFEDEAAGRIMAPLIWAWEHVPKLSLSVPIQLAR